MADLSVHEAAADRAETLLNPFRSDMRNLLKVSKKFTDAGKAYAAAGNELGSTLRKLGSQAEWAGHKEGQLGQRFTVFGNTVASLAYTNDEAMRAYSSVMSDRVARFLEFEFQKLAESRRKYDSLSSKARGAIDKKIDDPSAVKSLMNESVEAGRGLYAALDEMEAKLETRFTGMLVEALLALQKANVAGAKLMKNLDLASLGQTLQHRAAQLGVAADHEGVLKRKLGSFWKSVYAVLLDGNLEWYAHDTGTERKLTSGMRSNKGGDDASGSVDLRLATVKEVTGDDLSFEVWNPGHREPILFRAETGEERTVWLAAIRDLISSQLSQTVIQKGDAASSLGSSAKRDMLGSSTLRGGAMGDSIDNVPHSPKGGVIGNVPVPMGGLPGTLANSTGMGASGTDADRKGSKATSAKYDNAKIARLTGSLYDVTGNKRCADCDSRDPVWASINLGILVCIDCSGVHRQLGTHITKVRSLELDRWDPDLVLFMSHAGNAMVNGLFEAGVVFSHLQIPKPKARSNRDEKSKFIIAKYKDRSFIQKTKLSPPELTANLASAVERNAAATRLAELLLLVAWGADVNAGIPEHDNQTVMHRAAAYGSLVTVELLVQNGADVFATDGAGRTALHVAAAFDNYLVIQQLLNRVGKAEGIHAKDASGDTALDIATAKEGAESVRVLSGEGLPTRLLTADEQLGDDRSESLLYAMQVAVRERLRYLEKTVLPRLQSEAKHDRSGVARKLAKLAPEFDRASTWLGETRPTGAGVDTHSKVDAVAAALDDVDALLGALNGAAADAANVLQMQAIYECVHSLVVLTGEPEHAPALSDV